MFKLMGNKKLLMLMFALIFFMIVMALTAGQRALTWPEKFVKDTVLFTQHLFYKPAGYVSGFFEDIHRIRIAYEENKVMKMTLTQYARDTMRLNDLDAQNKRLKDLLGFTERQKQQDNYKYHVAEVVSASPDPYTNVVNINLGAKDGMKPNMAVMSVQGLIGRITKVSEFYSSVQLLSDIDDSSFIPKDTNDLGSKAISVTVKGKEQESFGIISHFDKEKQLLVMTKIVQSDPLAVGDTVVTSGLGEVFPRGIVIGTVVSRELDDFGITYKAEIKPLADFRHLREVLVVETPEAG